jgi:hypothetical protein
MATKRQIELDEAFGKAAEAAGWEADPDKVCAEVAKKIGATEKEIFDAVSVVMDEEYRTHFRLL